MLLKSLPGRAGQMILKAIAKGSIPEILRQTEVLINTVPGPAFASELAKRIPAAKHLKLVFDLNYAAADDALLSVARRRKILAVNGLGMLLEQGCLSFKYWTGKQAPKSVMARALGH